jgi:predicted nucleotidyltransferase
MCRIFANGHLPIEATKGDRPSNFLLNLLQHLALKRLYNEGNRAFDPMSTSLSDAQIYDRLGITPADLEAFCRQWHVAELSLFGSVLRDDFRPDSDIDILVTYLPTAERGLFEKMQMKEELEALLHRSVDLVSKKAIAQSRNWLRRRNILSTAEIIYVA